MCSFSKHLGIWWLQTMQCSLCMCPLKLTLFLAKVLLPCKSNLEHKTIPQTAAHRKVPSHVKQLKKAKSYPLLNEKIPSLPAESIAYHELYDIQWDIEYDVIEPDHPSPTPSNPFDCSKTPVSIHCYQGGNLLKMDDQKFSATS